MAAKTVTAPGPTPCRLRASAQVRRSSVILIVAGLIVIGAGLRSTATSSACCSLSSPCDHRRAAAQFVSPAPLAVLASAVSC